jgi:Flp pilus assembly protein TadG
MNAVRFRGRRSPTTAPLRRGAAAVEGAVVIGVFLIVLFGMLDVGLAVLQQNSLSEGVRRLARAAIVHGSLARNTSTAWGPASLSGLASDGSEPAATIQPVLIAMDSSQVAFTLEWLDGENQPDQRVRATLTYQHVPMVPLILGTTPINLSASSTMRIAH